MGDNNSVQLSSKKQTLFAYVMIKRALSAKNISPTSHSSITEKALSEVFSVLHDEIKRSIFENYNDDVIADADFNYKQRSHPGAIQHLK